MPERQATRVELLLEHQPVDAGLAVDDQVGLIYLEDAVEGAHVQHQLAGFRRERAADPAASTHRRHDHMAGSRPPQDRRHLRAA